MAHSIAKRLRGLFATFIALAAALSLVPATALAATWTGTQTGTITIDNLGAGDQVEIFQVATIELDSHNVTSYKANTTNFDSNSVDAYLASDGGADDAADLLEGMKGSAAAAFTDTVDAGEDSITSNQLAAGVYYVRIKPAADADYTYQAMVVKLEPVAGTGTSWTLENATATAKKTTTTLTKWVVGNDGGTVSANYGDTLTFAVTFNVGPDMTEFVLTDEMTGLEYAGNVVLHEGNDVSGDTVDADGNYTVETDRENPHTFKLRLSESFLESIETDTSYTVTYEATVCEHATQEGASNKVTSTIDSEGDDVEIEFGKAGVFKYGDTNTSSTYDDGEPVLSGAKFQVFKADGKTPVVDTKGKDVYVITDTDGFAWTNEDGEGAAQVLLKIGDKVIFKEVTAPSGYKLPADESNHFEATVVAMNSENGYVSVPNVASGPGEGINLPTTGGMGTIAFTAAGVVIIAGAAAFVVRSRKQD